ncbi:MAG: DUF4330 domain-containing protein [Defluviitaleaceae bacterium]|nr:DUF4330 domain-containing protein [Defluviitaleaceae bacterium]
MAEKKAKFNFIDALVVIAIIVAIAFASWYFLLRGESTEQREILFTVEIREQFAGQHENFTIGADVVESVLNFPLGIVDSVRVVPSQLLVFDYENMQHNLAEIPERYDIYVTVRGMAAVNDSHIMVEDLQLRVGRQMFLRGRGFAGYGFMTELSVIGD